MKEKPKEKSKATPKKPAVVPEAKTAAEKEAEDMKYLDSLLKEAEKESATFSNNRQETDDAYVDIGALLCINKK